MIVLAADDEVLERLEALNLPDVTWGERHADNGLFAPLNDPTGSLASDAAILSFVTIAFKSATSAVSFAKSVVDLMSDLKSRGAIYKSGFDKPKLAVDATTSPDDVANAITT